MTNIQRYRIAQQHSYCQHNVWLSSCIDSVSGKLSSRYPIVCLCWKCFSETVITMSDCQPALTVFHRNWHHNPLFSDCVDSVSAKLLSQCLIVRSRWKVFSENWHHNVWLSASDRWQCFGQYNHSVWSRASWQCFSKIVHTMSDFQRNCNHNILLSAIVDSVSARLSSHCLIVRLFWQYFS